MMIKCHGDVRTLVAEIIWPVCIYPAVLRMSSYCVSQTDAHIHIVVELKVGST